MLFLAALSELSLGNNRPAAKMMEEAFQCDQETLSPFLNGKPITLCPLNTNGEFCAKFPLIIMPFENQPEIKMRPAISLPRVRLPSMEFKIEEKVKDFFDFSKISPKPEAPWLNRIRGSIQFTDSIVEMEVEMSESESDTKKEEKYTEEMWDENRKVKSLLPIRHRSLDPLDSSKEILRNIDEITSKNPKNSNPPDHILRKIKDVCKPD